MTSFRDALVERRIREAQARGEFENLPGAGAPLDLTDDALVPEELRAAYRLMKNAGCLPPELETHGEIRRIELLLQATRDEAERAALLARIDFLLSRRAAGRRHGHLAVQEDYADELARRLRAHRRARDATS
jgi:hypothetical protein